jgi:NCAIR mutase (PurE)-related protein
MYTREAIEAILKKVAAREISPQFAFQKLRNLSYESLRFARLDHHRFVRKNLPEAVYAPGKTIEQLEKIIRSLSKAGRPVLITRLEEKGFRKLKTRFPRLKYSKIARTAYLGSFSSLPHTGPRMGRGGRRPTPVGQAADGRSIIWHRSVGSAKQSQSQRLPRPASAGLAMTVTGGTVALVTAGTSDIPVAEEAAVTLEALGRKASRFYDCGVAGLHRLLDQIRNIEKSDVIICVAGMEGALPSVLAGLVSKPVIAVPTSVGYGSSFKGVAPLLTMLNSCAQGVAVVNIDSGFNAACFAHLVLDRI